jgi:hypothetical protein
MALLHVPLSQVNEQQLQRLIDGKVAEARSIEYKRDTYGDSEADRAEYLADVSSFANTAGGDLIIGMAAAAGVPTALTPLKIDLDGEVLRLDNMVRSSLQPRIAHIDFKPVPVASGGQVLLVRVQRSFNAPHRIVRNGKGQNRFWARSSAGKYEPNVDELRALFTLDPQLTERIRDFRVERVAKIAAGATPVRLMGQACLTMHIVPFSSFDPGMLLPLSSVEKNPHAFAPIGSRGAQDWSINFDGIRITSNSDQNAAKQRAYTQVYRNGRIEAVASNITGGERPEGMPPRLNSLAVEGDVVPTLVRYLQGLHKHGFEPPYAIMVSLIGVKGVQINGGEHVGYINENMTILTEDQLHFTEVIFDELPGGNKECGAMLKPFIQQLANAAGYSTSTSFDTNGEYIRLFR